MSTGFHCNVSVSVRRSYEALVECFCSSVITLQGNSVYGCKKRKLQTKNIHISFILTSTVSPQNKDCGVCPQCHCLSILVAKRATFWFSVRCAVRGLCHQQEAEESELSAVTCHQSLCDESTGWGKWSVWLHPVCSEKMKKKKKSKKRLAHC